MENEYLSPSAIEEVPGYEIRTFEVPVNNGGYFTTVKVRVPNPKKKNIKPVFTALLAAGFALLSLGGWKLMVNAKGEAPAMNFTQVDSYNTTYEIQYTIMPGDTLEEITARAGNLQTVQAVAEQNGIANKNMIYAGDKINILVRACYLEIFGYKEITQEVSEVEKVAQYLNLVFFVENGNPIYTTRKAEAWHYWAEAEYLARTLNGENPDYQVLPIDNPAGALSEHSHWPSRIAELLWQAIDTAHEQAAEYNMGNEKFPRYPEFTPKAPACAVPLTPAPSATYRP